MLLCVSTFSSFSFFTEPVLYGIQRVFLAEKYVYVLDRIHSHLLKAVSPAVVSFLLCIIDFPLSTGPFLPAQKMT